MISFQRKEEEQDHRSHEVEKGKLKRVGLGSQGRVSWSFPIQTECGSPPPITPQQRPPRHTENRNLLCFITRAALWSLRLSSFLCPFPSQGCLMPHRFK